MTESAVGKGRQIPRCARNDKNKCESEIEISYDCGDAGDCGRGSDPAGD
jgi:hypothetical protein